MIFYFSFFIYIEYYLGLPISVFGVFEKEYSNSMINIFSCFETYHNKFSIFSLKENNFEDIINRSFILEDEKIVDIPMPKKIEYMYLIRFFNKSIPYFNELRENEENKIISGNGNEGLSIDYKINIEKTKGVKLSEICDLMVKANKEFELDNKKSAEIFKNNFSIIEKETEDYINYDEFSEFFKFKRKIQILICDYVESTIDIIINMFKFVENILIEFLDNCKEMSYNIILMKDFEKIILKLIPNFENKWMLNDYFQYNYIII
jgi:hypothetical protein